MYNKNNFMASVWLTKHSCYTKDISGGEPTKIVAYVIAFEM